MDCTISTDSWDSVEFLFGWVLLQFFLLFKAMLLVSAVNLNILQMIFGVALIA